MNLSELTSEIKKFAQDRDWEQFHNPKDLAIALSIEVSELQEIMLWTTTELSSKKIQEKKEAVENEVGDILVYLLRFCDITGIDPVSVAQKKCYSMQKNIQYINPRAILKNILSCNAKKPGHHSTT